MGGKKDFAIKIRYGATPARGELPMGPYGPAIIGGGSLNSMNNAMMQMQKNWDRWLLVQLTTLTTFRIPWALDNNLMDKVLVLIIRMDLHRLRIIKLTVNLHLIRPTVNLQLLHHIMFHHLPPLLILQLAN